MSDILKDLKNIEEAIDRELLEERLEEFVDKVLDFRTKHNISDADWIEENGIKKLKWELPTREDVKADVLRLVKSFDSPTTIKTASCGYMLSKDHQGYISFHYGVYL
jgi:hypothetical protein